MASGQELPQPGDRPRRGYRARPGRAAWSIAQGRRRNGQWRRRPGGGPKKSKKPRAVSGCGNASHCTTGCRMDRSFITSPRTIAPRTAKANKGQSAQAVRAWWLRPRPMRCSSGGDPGTVVSGLFQARAHFQGRRSILGLGAFRTRPA
jgi:hypothetical protein